jgi:hypothetical protein
MEKKNRTGLRRGVEKATKYAGVDEVQGESWRMASFISVILEYEHG